MTEIEIHPAWLRTWAFTDHCRFCGHRTQHDSQKLGRVEHSKHVDRCMREKGLK